MHNDRQNQDVSRRRRQIWAVSEKETKPVSQPTSSSNLGVNDHQPVREISYINHGPIHASLKPWSLRTSTELDL